MATLTKFLISFKMRQLWEAELSSSMLAFQKMETPPIATICILIGLMQRKPSESCQKDVTKIKLITDYPRGNGTTLSTVRDQLCVRLLLLVAKQHR